MIGTLSARTKSLTRRTLRVSCASTLSLQWRRANERYLSQFSCLLAPRSRCLANSVRDESAKTDSIGIAERLPTSAAFRRNRQRLPSNLHIENLSVSSRRLSRTASASTFPMKPSGNPESRRINERVVAQYLPIFRVVLRKQGYGNVPGCLRLVRALLACEIVIGLKRSTRALS